MNVSIDHVRRPETVILIVSITMDHPIQLSAFGHLNGVPCGPI